ncbi:DNA cytosine methyltransferase [Kitasatospora sp. MBT66]|uniref:DNA cytosine methyltransferase n=1 Tax=Kitasatospora sp. MBT66 TaxID=1444769 RepID=UPI000B0E7A56|nr:DNA cytosine methyltransferase [Kitasatospora sp. MBT66]
MASTDHAGSSTRNPITVMDLFAGCGGLTAGFHSYSEDHSSPARFESIAAVEFDDAAAATYAVNHPSARVYACDIRDFDPAPYADQADVIAGGPPCQGFSSLGKQHADDPRNEMWREYMRTVEIVRPMIFVLENVDRFLVSAEFAQLQEAAAPGGALADYQLAAKIVNSADYGVPQARKRVIVIGTRKDIPQLLHPASTHAKSVKLQETTLFSAEEDTGRLPWVSVAGVFERSARLEITGTDLPPLSCAPLGRLVPGAFRTTDLHIGRTPRPLSLARYAAIPVGGNRRNLQGRYAVIEGREVYLSTESWDRHTSGTGDVMGRLYPDRPAVTIRTEFFKPEKGRYLHPTRHRPITHYEAALIQGFPDTYRWCGTKIEIARQIGNSVPVGLGRALAQAIHAHLLAH